MEDGFDGGPEFVPLPDDAPAPAGPPIPEPAPAGPQVKPGQVAEFLQALTGAVGSITGGTDGPVAADLRMTDDEAKMIAPGLAEYVNRVPAAAAVVGSGHIGTMVLGLAAYAGRIVQERRANLAHRAAMDDAYAGADDLEDAELQYARESEPPPIIDGDGPLVIHSTEREPS